LSQKKNSAIRGIPPIIVFLKAIKSLSLVALSLRLCLQAWRGEKRKVLRGGKYEGKWRNLSKNLKE